MARAWYAGRSADTGGKGWLLRSEFRAVLREKLNITDKGAKLLVFAGLGSWWMQDGERILFAGQEMLALKFGITLGDAVLLPNECLRGSKKFRAALFSTYFAPHAKTKSRDEMCRTFGVDRKTISHWVKAAEITKKPRWAYAKKINMEFIPTADRKLTKSGKLGGLFLKDMDSDGELEIVWQLPNEYSSPGLSAEKKLQSKLGRPSNLCRPARNSQSWAIPRPLYFDHSSPHRRAAALSKAMRGAPQGEGYYFYEREVKGLGRVSSFVCA